MNAPTYRDIWSTLSKIDCTDKIEKKQNLSYLSWATAWGILMDNYPDATYHHPEPQSYIDGTVTVFCDVTIGSCVRSMRLPVMDHRNKAIANPDACARNKAEMRCLVKAIALFGLGHYIYAGEDIPSASEAPVSSPALTEQQVAQLKAYLAKFDVATTVRFLKAFRSESVETLPAPLYEEACKRLRAKIAELPK